MSVQLSDNLQNNRNSKSGKLLPSLLCSPPLPPHTARPPVLARVWYLAAYLLVSNDTFTSCHLQRFVWSIKTPKNEYEKSQAQNAERQKQEDRRGGGGAEQEYPYQIQSWQVLQSPDMPPRTHLPHHPVFLSLSRLASLTHHFGRILCLPANST